MGRFVKLDFIRRQIKAPNCARFVCSCRVMATPGDARTAPRIRPFAFFSLLPLFHPVSWQQNIINPPVQAQRSPLQPHCSQPCLGEQARAIFVHPILQTPCCHLNCAQLGSGEGSPGGRAPSAPPGAPTTWRRCPRVWKEREGSGSSPESQGGFPGRKGTFEASMT